MSHGSIHFKALFEELDSIQLKTRFGRTKAIELRLYEHREVEHR